MAHEFRLPDIGEGLTEAEIVRWLVAVGDPVDVDQPVVEVETDKAVVEIPAPFAGVVLYHGAAEGETISVGEVLVVVGEAGERWEEAPSHEAELGEAAQPIVGSLSSDAVDLDSRPDAEIRTTERKVLALPVVRKLAKELGVDLERVHGSGPQGRITREDVMAARGHAESGGVRTEPPTAQSRPQPRTGGERRPLSKLRRTIAANMSRSWAQIPHVTTFDEVDASRLLQVKKALTKRHDQPVSIDALVVKAVIPALEQFQEFEAWLDGDDLVIPERHDIGIAVDTSDGLLVVVVRDVGARDVLELSEELARLSAGAKKRILGPEELTGQSFTVSNIGAVGGGYGTPLIPPGTTAILSVGRAADKPVARDGRIEIAPMMPLSLSFDHRVIDGGLGRRFMAMVIENLEEPALFMA